MSENVVRLLNESKVARWTALLLVAFTMLSAYFFVDMIAPLQSLLEINYKWEPSVYGFFSGSEYMLNVLGFLIISGIILDKMGIRFTGLTAAIVMLTGGLIKLYALTPAFYEGGFGYDFFNSFWTNMPPTAKLASIGYAIFGIGVEMVGITVSRAIVKWFRGKELALAMGMEMATARLGASVAFFFSANIAGVKVVNGVIQGNVLNSVYVGVALLSIGFLTFLTYTFMDKKLDNQIKDAGNNEPSSEFKLSDIGKILTNKAFILISLLCVLFYSGVFPFLKYAVNMMQNKLGVSAEIGGYISGLLPVGTIILTPLIGAYLDNKGKGATIMIGGATLLTIAHLTYAIIPLNMVLAVAAIMVLGVAFSLVPASMWPSIPKIVEDRYLGSAYALIFWIQNIGLMTLPWLVGVVLQQANPGVSERIAAGDTTAVYDYTFPMLMFAGLGICAIILGFLLRVEDKKKGYGLELPNIKK
ncbi:MAG: MFS transporter [Candidatus Kapabacteria bacterium]|nr:MFS transporter [Candidatus Kapabacteria bacterium]